MECNIRKWRITDAADLATALNNKSIHNHLRDGLPFPYTEKDAKDFISAMLQADKNSTFAFAITVDDIAVGSIRISRKDNIHYCTAEMGYFVSEQFWGQGIGTSAIKNICRYIFEHTDIKSNRVGLHRFRSFTKTFLSRVIFTIKYSPSLFSWRGLPTDHIGIPRQVYFPT